MSLSIANHVGCAGFYDPITVFLGFGGVYDEDDGAENLHELPPEPGFTWWFRCVFSSSSTI